jgi:hypothetical protein
MSKNIYRVNKKSDLDEIIKNNFYKPICLIFVTKSADTKLYNDITTSLLAISKEQQYNMLILIDFDDFIDNIDYFASIKNNTPYFISYFKGKTIYICDNKENFIPIVINNLAKIHTSYINKLINTFNQNNDILINDENVKKDETIEAKGEAKGEEVEVEVVGEESEAEEEEEEEEEEAEEEAEDDEEEAEEAEEAEAEEAEDDEEDNMIKKEKEKLKKIKELKRLQNMLKK